MIVTMFVVFMSHIAFATVITVNGDGTADYQTIQKRSMLQVTATKLLSRRGPIQAAVMLSILAAKKFGFIVVMVQQRQFLMVRINAELLYAVAVKQV